jgi:hypothetical protein
MLIGLLCQVDFSSSFIICLFVGVFFVKLLKLKIPYNYVAETRPLMSTANVESASAEDLVHMIHSMTENSAMKSERLAVIESLLTRQLYKMPPSLILQACHGLYLQDHNCSPFFSQTFSVLDDIFNRLAPKTDDVTMLMLFIFVHGSAPSMLFHNIEQHLLQHLDVFDINDLGVICAGFFRGNARMSSQDLIDKMAEKLLQEIDNVDAYLLLDFLKLFRHAGYIKLSFYNRLAEKLVQSDMLHMYKSVNPLMHIAFAYSSLSIKHTALFDALFTNIEKLVKIHKTVRTKDISKFVWACGTLQFMPENGHERYKLLINTFWSNKSDARNYPDSCAELLMGLAYLEIFPQDLINHCLSPEVVPNLIGTFFFLIYQ